MEMAVFKPKGVRSLERTTATILEAILFQTTRYLAKDYSLMLYIAVEWCDGFSLDHFIVFLNFLMKVFLISRSFDRECL